jgi:hypothetical protein
LEVGNWPRGKSARRDIDSAIDHEVQWHVPDGLLFDYLESYLANDSCILAIGSDAVRAERLMRRVESDLEMSVQYRSARMILHRESTESDVQRFVDHMKFRKIREVRANGDVIREVAWQVDQGLNMYYVEEDVSGCNFLQVMDDSREDVDDIADALAVYFRPWKLAEVLEAVEVVQGVENKAAAIPAIKKRADGEGAKVYFADEAACRTDHHGGTT